MTTIQGSKGVAVTPFLWFNDNAEQAVDFYVGIFPQASVSKVIRYGKAGPGAEGTVMTIAFSLAGQEFTALNGGPYFTFSGAISFVVHCNTQDEVDHFWTHLGDGGTVHQCGWVTDRFGITKVGSAVYGVLLRQIPGQLAFTVDTKTLTPLLPLTFTPALAADLVGSFSPEDEPTSTLTLNADGSYTVVVGATADPSCPKAGGSESGTYQYEPSTGVFTAIATVDNNGECGLSHPDGIVRVKKVGTTLYYMSKDNGVAFEMKLNRK